jgi:alkylated DNA nucleotide flippase Atl1
MESRAGVRRFSQADAQRCLNNKKLVMFGNSNTRTLFIALESLLRGTPMMSRTAAKQMCDNSRTNHHCWTRIPTSGTRIQTDKHTMNLNASSDQKNEGILAVNGSISLRYFSYTKGLYDAELRDRLLREEAEEEQPPPLASRTLLRGSEKVEGALSLTSSSWRWPADIVIGNSGLNSIQLYDDPVWEKEHRGNTQNLARLVADWLLAPVATTGAMVANTSTATPSLKSSEVLAKSSSGGMRNRHEGAHEQKKGPLAHEAEAGDGNTEEEDDPGCDARQDVGMSDKVFLWHLTTPVCENQPHFRRYRYNAKHWRHRSLDAINKAVRRSNDYAWQAMRLAADMLTAATAGAAEQQQQAATKEGIRRRSDDTVGANHWSCDHRAPQGSKNRILVLDGWGMVAGSYNESSQDEFGGAEKGRWVRELCPYYDDPLHHRFMDREMVQLLLNSVCP